MTLRPLGPATVLALSTLLACSAGDPAPGGGGDDDSSDVGGDKPPHWGYEADNGPERWADLDAEFAACDIDRADQRQSPIDLAVQANAGQSCATGGIDAIEYQLSQGSFLDNGHTVQVNFDPTRNKIVVGGVDYALAQYHVHTPSEHTIDGEEAPLEIHLVHKAADGKLAVLGILADVCAGNDDFRRAELDFSGELTATPVAAEEPIDPSALLPDVEIVYSYPGSLTTPPCSETVSWFVFQDPICVDAGQLKIIQDQIEGENARRPVAPLGQRELRLCN